MCRRLASWEGTLTVWACWLALYSAVVHGRRTPRTPLVVAALVAVLCGEVVREVLFYQGGLFQGLPLNQGFYLAYNGACPSPFRSLLGLAVRSRTGSAARAGRASR